MNHTPSTPVAAKPTKNPTTRLIMFLLLALFASCSSAQNSDPVDGPATLTAAAAQAQEIAAGNARDLNQKARNPDIDSAELDHRLVPMTKAELAELAADWLAIVKRKTEMVMSEEIAIDQTSDLAEDAARSKLTTLVRERNILFGKFAQVISAWEKKGGDKDSIAEYRAYRNAVLMEETRTSDLHTLASEARAWMSDREGGLALLKNGTIVLVAMLALFAIARLLRRFARGWIAHIPNLSKLLQGFLATIIYWLVLAAGLMVLLSALGVDVSPVFALIGGASFILAFAFQDTLGNLASGLMIMINRPFDEGHFVDIGGVAGTVRSVSIVATTVTTPDNQIIVIPNKNVWGNVITNVTASVTRRVDLVFGISYEDSIPAALKVIESTVSSHPLVLQDPAPVIRVHELADSSVNFVCRPWVNTSDYWTVFWDLTQQIKENFDAAGISIPYPQRDVHVHTVAPAMLESSTKVARD